MATRYCGPGGNDANDGLSWANRKLTLNGVEDSPVAAGDICYIGPGTYREMLTVDVSGSAGSPITYIGDYTGANTDGVGGVVRITGSDDDQSATRSNAITATTKTHRTFRGFLANVCTSPVINLGTNCNDWLLDKLFVVGGGNAMGINVSGATQANVTISNCYIYGPGGATAHGIHFSHSATVNDCAHMVSNCIVKGWRGTGIASTRVGGITVKNCTVQQCANGIRVVTALASGQTMTVNNCIVDSCGVAMSATVTGELVEDYNSIYAAATTHTNTNVGANSNTYPPLYDARWFFEAVNGGTLLTPFDLSAASKMVNLAGTSPTTTDLRGTTIVGAQREWGALEHDPALAIKATTSSGGGGPVIGSRIIRGIGAI